MQNQFYTWIILTCLLYLHQEWTVCEASVGWFVSLTAETNTLLPPPALRRLCCCSRRSEVTPPSEDRTGNGSERISHDLKIQPEFCLQYVDHELLEKRSIMRKWTLRWKLPKFACGLWLVLLVSRVCVCDGERAASVTDCSKHERHTRNYDYMEGGDVRIRRLYSRTQWFLMIDEYGNINGTQDPNNCYSKSYSHQSRLRVSVACQELNSWYITVWRKITLTNVRWCTYEYLKMSKLHGGFNWMYSHFWSQKMCKIVEGLLCDSRECFPTVSSGQSSSGIESRSRGSVTKSDRRKEKQVFASVFIALVSLRYRT